MPRKPRVFYRVIYDVHKLCDTIVKGIFRVRIVIYRKLVAMVAKWQRKWAFCKLKNSKIPIFSFFV